MAPLLLDSASAVTLPVWPLVLIVAAASLSLVLLLALCARCNRAEDCKENGVNVVLTNAVHGERGQQGHLLGGGEETNGEVTNGTGAAQQQEDLSPSSATERQDDESADPVAGDECPDKAADEPPSPKATSCCPRRQRRWGRRAEGRNAATAARRDSGADDNLYEDVENAVRGLVQAEGTQPTPAPRPSESRGQVAPQAEPCYAEVRKKTKEGGAVKSTPRENKKMVAFKDSKGECHGDSEEVAPPPPEKTWAQQRAQEEEGNAPASDSNPTASGSGGQAAPREAEVLYATLEEAGAKSEEAVTNPSDRAPPPQRPPSVQRPMFLPRNNETTHVTYAEVRLQPAKSEDQQRRSNSEVHYATIVGTVSGGGDSECFYATVQEAMPASRK
ncbi:uncharacterized protein LOC116941657 isoform X1 [Petromyzon marinus]|uniref:uncharacterized protein LOC116941657 isoform X1 n=1 Tax=Petromyzon marinus TaxID=7757 RepID=UPI003F717351